MKSTKLASILTTRRESARVFAVIAICCTVSRVYGIDDPNLFGMVGGAFGEVIRLNAVRPPLAAGITSGPCILALGFADSAGTPVGNTVTADLGPGQAAFAEVDFSSLAIRGGQRFELRPVATAAYRAAQADAASQPRCMTAPRGGPPFMPDRICRP